MLIGDLLDREDGVANEVEACACTSAIASRMSRDHDIGVVGDQPDIPMLLRVHLDEIAAMRGQVLERYRLALACSLRRHRSQAAALLRQFAMSPE